MRRNQTQNHQAAAQKQGRFTYREVPSEEQIQETVQVPLETYPECGEPLEDRATYEQVQVDLPQGKPIVVRFLTESSYGKRCRKAGAVSPS